MRYLLTFSCILFINLTFAQETKLGSELFWSQLQKFCGSSFEGTITEGPANDDFRGKKLVMHVKSCEPNRIRIPFFVGEDKSRTWILTLKNGLITLKHDHRHEDGSEDNITQYGGTNTNSGLSNLQMFPADPQTCELIGYACANLWWITINETSFTYNLMRIGSERRFTVTFDLTKMVENPSAPWGWRD
ncbi:MAG: hypothetical protein ACK4RM_00525 [Flavobacterium sp.]